MKNLRKIIATTCVSTIMMTSIAGAFTDLPTSHWAYNSVNKMQQEGIITGFEDGTFRPDEAVTREQFVTLLAKKMNLPAPIITIPLGDVEDGRWSKEFIDKCVYFLPGGYVEDDTYYFRPSDKSLREEIAFAMVMALGLEESTPNYSVLDKFSDKSLINSEYYDLVAIAVERGIMNGNANGTFNPKGALTRAEGATVVKNILSKNIIVLPEPKPVDTYAPNSMIEKLGIYFCM